MGEGPVLLGAYRLPDPDHAGGVLRHRGRALLVACRVTAAPGLPAHGRRATVSSGTAFEVLRAIEHRRESAAALPDVLVYRKTAPLSVSVEQDTQRAAQAAALDTLDAFMAEWFVNPRDGFNAAFHSFKHADEFEQIFEMHLRAWLRENRRLGRERVWRVEERGSPFRGLKPFEPEHRDAFFGRKADIERARERLEDAAAAGCGFLVIEGASGTGKSSLARAGLLPRLQDLDPDLRTAIMVPRADPLQDLVDALFGEQTLPELASGDSASPDSLAGHLARGGDVTPILRALDRAAAALAEHEGRQSAPDLGLAILVDQLENVFAESVSASARTGLCDALAALARSGRVRVIATLRADGRAAALSEPSLARLIDNGAGLALAPPGPEALSEIVRGPALAAGLAFSRRAEDGLGLDEVLIRDAGGTDALPLLQFVLDELYEAAVARVRAAGRRLGEVADDEPVATLDFVDYRGIERAVEMKAEEAFSSLERKAQAALPRLVRTLTEPGPGGIPVLRAAAAGDAAPGADAQALVAALVDARILVRDGELLRFSHETALRGWRRAAEAATEAATFLRIRADVARQQDRWIAGGRHRSLLIPPGVRLAEAEAMQKAHGEELAPYADFVGHSRRWARLGQTLTGAAAVLFAGVAIAALVFFQRSEQATARALAEAARAEAGEAAAEAALREATEAANTLVFQLANEFSNRGLPSALTRTILDRATALQDGLTARFPNDSTLQRSNAAALTALGDLSARDVDMTSALAAYSRAIDILRSLSLAEPKDALVMQNLAATLGRLGVLNENLGEVESAILLHDEAAEIYRTLKTLEPNIAGWYRGAAISTYHVGNIRRRTGDLQGALQLYNDARREAEAAAFVSRGDHDFLGTEASILYSIGETHDLLGNSGEALTAVEEGLQIYRRLSILEPDNFEWWLGAGTGLLKIGRISSERGDVAGAFNAFAEGSRILYWLLTKDPDHTIIQGQLAVLLSNSASVRRSTGDLQGAISEYSEAARLLRQLAERSEDFLAYSGEGWYILKQVGDIFLIQQDFASARKSFGEGLEWARAVQKNELSADASMLAASTFLESIGMIDLSENRGRQASETFSEALELRRTLAQKAPQSAETLYPVFRNQINLLEALLLAEIEQTEFDLLRRLIIDTLATATRMEELGFLTDEERNVILPGLRQMLDDLQ